MVEMFRKKYDNKNSMDSPRHTVAMKEISRTKGGRKRLNLLVDESYRSTVHFVELLQLLANNCSYIN